MNYILAPSKNEFNIRLRLTKRYKLSLKIWKRQKLAQETKQDNCEKKSLHDEKSW